MFVRLILAKNIEMLAQKYLVFLHIDLMAMKTLLIPLALLTVVLSLLPSVAPAQNETGTRYLKKENFQFMRYWYDSTTAVYQVRYPIIRNIPPISPSMPLDIMLSYVIADSICRFAPQKEITTIMKGWTSMNDTLRYAAKFLYRMMDYNPIIFRQYQDQVTLLRGSPFKTYFIDVKNGIRTRYMNLVPSSEKNAVRTLLGAEYILRVKVLAIDSMLGKVSSGMRYRVTAKVIDTLKGQVFQAAPCSEYLTQTMLADNTPCIRFEYGTRNYFTPGQATAMLAAGAEYEPWPYLHQDSAFMRARDVFAMTVGQEAIIFLEHDAQKFDYEADYYNLSLSTVYGYNAIPIIDGQVRDVNKVWSNNLWMSYTDWKNRLTEIRNKILNGSY